MRTPPPPSPRDYLRFSNTTGILQKRKNYVVYWCSSKETSAPPPKKNPGSAPELQPTTTTDSIRTKMNNMSTTVRSNNSNNLTSLSSPAHMDFPSRAEEIVVYSALLFEALFIVTGNLVTIVFFALERELRKRKSLFLVMNMAFADAMLEAVSIRSFVCLFKGLS